MNTQIREQMLLTTVVQKPHQGSFPKSGCYRFRGSFFVTFLEKQKSKEENIKENSRNRR